MVREEAPFVHPTILKFELLTQGLQVADNARSALQKYTKNQYAIGATGKAFLDLVLKPSKIYVGIPLGGPFTEAITENTPFLLERINNRWFITKKRWELNDAGKEICTKEDSPARIMMEVDVFPRPPFYGKKTLRGIPMAEIMPVTGDFAGATITPHCDFWGHYDASLKGYECKFCGIGVNMAEGRDLVNKQPEDFIETLKEARKYKYFRHGPVFAGGSYPKPDRGHKLHAKYLIELRKAFPDNWLRLTICPPENEKDVDLLFHAGANLVGYNYEIFDNELYQKLCPGKFHDINRGQGHDHYDYIMRYGVNKFGSGSIHSNLLAGIEPVESTILGIEHLSSMGVIPTVFVFHPLKGTQMEQQPTASPLDLIRIYRELRKITMKYRVDTACAGCHRMMVNTKIFDGIIPVLPDITDKEIERHGLPLSEVNASWKRSFSLISAKSSPSACRES